MKIADVVGHDRARGVLARALERDRLPPALLLSGPAGVGKKSLALAVAQAALCEKAPAAEPCGECRTCRRVDKAASPAGLESLREEARSRPDEDERCNFRLHPDLVLLEGWWLTRTGRPRPEPEIRVGQVRALVAEVPGAPFEARRRVFVIDDAHTMNESSQNALLKSLEEPPPRSHLVLVTSQPEDLRQTIRSRCQVLRFGPLPRAVIARHLVERLGVTAEEAELRAALGAGSLAAAVALESDGYREMRARLLDVLERVQDASALGRMEQAESLDQVGDATTLLTTLRSLLRDVAASRVGAPPGSLLNADVADRIAVLARGPLGARAADLAEQVAESRRAIRGFGNRLLTFDLLVDTLSDG